MSECPCKGCTPETGRSPTCHPNCKKYLDWKKEHDEQVEKERLERQLGYSRRAPRWYQARDGYWRNDALERRRKS